MSGNSLNGLLRYELIACTPTHTHKSCGFPDLILVIFRLHSVDYVVYEYTCIAYTQFISQLCTEREREREREREMNIGSSSSIVVQWFTCYVHHTSPHKVKLQNDIT